MQRQCHAAVAAWLSGLTGARANDFLGATAEHFEQAGDSAQAAEFFARAAEHAAARHAHETVLDYVAKALALTGQRTRKTPNNHTLQPKPADPPDQRLLRWR